MGPGKSNGRHLPRFVSIDEGYSVTQNLNDFEEAAIRHAARKTGWTGDLESGIATLRVSERDPDAVGFHSTIVQGNHGFKLSNTSPAQSPTLIIRHSKLKHDGIVTVWVSAEGWITGIEAVTFASESWPDGDASDFLFE